eukprot:Anaeramoba_ignava/c21018_g1_i4.p2 GENE.c21018_g1_i4~~c21018_g1_i4.p2  ORF type:complete len:100 (-),score=39.54 c21018_g1_i4:1387-1686(-)
MEIISQTIHHNRSLIATGQENIDPIVCVWDTEKVTLRSKFTIKNINGVVSIAFDSSGSYLFVISGDEKTSIQIWDWEKRTKIASIIGSTEKVFFSNIEK